MLHVFTEEAVQGLVAVDSDPMFTAQEPQILRGEGMETVQARFWFIVFYGVCDRFCHSFKTFLCQSTEIKTDR